MHNNKQGRTLTKTKQPALFTDEQKVSFSHVEWELHNRRVKNLHDRKGVTTRNSCFHNCTPGDWCHSSSSCRSDCPVSQLPDIAALPAIVPCTGSLDCVCSVCLDLPF